MDRTIQACIDATQRNLQNGECIIQIRLAEPLPQGKADYFTRYKVDIGVPNGSGTEISSRRCVVVQVSSNTGNASIDAGLGWDPIPNVVGL